MLTIAKIVVGNLSVNCYIVRNGALETLIVDPGADAGAIAKTIAHCRLTVKGYLITHGHTDHVGALAALQEHIPAPIAMHGADLKWAFTESNQLPPYCSVPQKPGRIECLLKGGEIFGGMKSAALDPAGPKGGPAAAGQRGSRPSSSGKLQLRHAEDFSFRVIHTPGHSPGGVCFYFPDDHILFSGDTLFRDSVGRTDLPGGSMEQLASSLKIIAALPPQTKIYPGHGPETTIARELESNRFLR
ncbi:MAG: MBL fold metallo-hydrolase [Kiritimatiellae bacterium]|nr:MBL fold metallo-hydrolase [Kiritimatiellia bacterium]